MTKDLEVVLRAAAKHAAHGFIDNTDAPLDKLAAGMRRLQRRQRRPKQKDTYDPAQNPWRVEVVASWLAVYEAHKEGP